MVVVVFEIVTREDGSTGLGNSIELSVEDAIEQIEAGTVTSGIAPFGVVPDAWREA